MWVVIGSGTPAMSEISVLQPAVALTTWPASTRPRFVCTAVMRPLDALEPGHLGVGMDLRAARVGAAREAPDDRVVADDAARRVIQRAHDRIRRVLADVHRRREPLHLVGPDQRASRSRAAG